MPEHAPARTLAAEPLTSAGTLPEPETALELRAVLKMFGGGRALRLRWRRQPAKAAVRAVEGASFPVTRGEIFGMLGPNGSGKSTLIRLVSTLLLPDEGSVRVFGLEPERDELAVQRLINHVSVEASFFKKLSPLENLMYAARLYGVALAVARARIDEILGRLSIERRSLRAPMDQISRGMHRRWRSPAPSLPRPCFCSGGQIVSNALA